MNNERIERQDHRTPYGRVAAGLGAVAVGLYTAWLARLFVSILASQQPSGGGTWPLPGLFFVATLLSAAIGGLALARLAIGRSRAARPMLWVSGGALVGFGILSGFSVGGAILPLGMALVLAAVVAGVGRPRRLVVGLVTAAAVGALAFVATPMLEALAWIGAPALPTDEVVPQPGAIDVPLTKPISVSTKPLPFNHGTSQSLCVRYLDRGLAWLRPAVPGVEGGRGSMGARGDVGRTTFTFAPTPAFEACRKVGVTVIAGGYRPYRFAFETACPGR